MSENKERMAQLQASFNHPDVTLGQIRAEWNEHPDNQYIIRDDDIEEYYKQAASILSHLKSQGWRSPGDCKKCLEGLDVLMKPPIKKKADILSRIKQMKCPYTKDQLRKENHDWIYGWGECKKDILAKLK